MENEEQNREKTPDSAASSGRWSRKWEGATRMQRVYYLFGLFMILFYVGLSYIMIFSPIFVERISAPMRYGLGALFFIYGIFRGYRQVKESQRRDEE